MRVGQFLIGCSVLVLAGGAARADVVISKQATANMSCSAGVCSPTAAKATLNATDLTNMLASGDVTVTTGSGAANIVVKDGFSWTSTSRLTLDAMQSVEFDKPVTVAGTGAVTVTTNDGGSGGDLLFSDKGNLTFWDLSSSLVINGNSYTLVGDIKTLAADIAAKPSGFYALANDYDASIDGTYTSAPVSTEVTGTVEGLGHAISSLTINGAGTLAFFAEASGILRDIGLSNVVVSGTGGGATLLAIDDAVTILGCYATGDVVAVNGGVAGGLVAASRQVHGKIGRSHTAVSVTVPANAVAGGLAGNSSASIELSYATGRVRGGDNAWVGGLVGFLNFLGTVSRTYAKGEVTGTQNSAVGGLVGVATGGSQIHESYARGASKGGLIADIGGFAGEIGGAKLQSSYSTGRVKGGNVSGGFVGNAMGSDDLAFDYWDTQTSGKSRHEGYGECHDSNCGRAIKGLKTEAFQAGLPPGFDPNVWAIDPNINGGFPYLIDNTPPK